MKSLLEIDTSVLPWLSRACKGVDYFVTEYFQAKGVELTKVQFVMLKKLVENDGQPQHNLAFLTNRDKTSLARLISTMEKKGMVRREVCEKDRRINHVFITEHGKSTLEQAVPVLHESIKIIQTEISISDLKKTIDVLKKLVKNIQPAESHSMN